MRDLSTHFSEFRSGIVGVDATLDTLLGVKPLVYVDWTASGRGYAPLEDEVRALLPYYANTHSEDSYVGRRTSERYHAALEAVRRHVNAAPTDVALFRGSGATGAVNWLQYMLGLRGGDPGAAARPLVMVTHMEHHSNQTSWEECAAEVVIVQPNGAGLPDLDHLEKLCREGSASGRRLIGAFTACSNVTGVETDVHEMARILHRYGGRIFVDYAASAPYVAIDMHPEDQQAGLDAIYFSPHKFLGGPGAAGIVVFDSGLYARTIPVFVGGGIVKWTNPFGEHRFHDGIDVREDAGTPAILQGIRAALALGVKEQMQPDLIQQRKKELLDRAMAGLREIEGVHVLAGEHGARQGIISFTVEGLHYGLMVNLLSDLHGIQARGGCSCAGTYGHYLFDIDRSRSHEITELIDRGDNSMKPGWVRISLHPTMTGEELELVLAAISDIVSRREELKSYYAYDSASNSWRFCGRQIK